MTRRRHAKGIIEIAKSNARVESRVLLSCSQWSLYSFVTHEAPELVVPFLVDQLHFDTRGSSSIDMSNVTIDHDLSRFRFPLRLYRTIIFLFGELDNHVLTFLQLSHHVFVDHDVEAFRVYAGDACDTRGVDVAFATNAVDEVFDRALHEIHRSIIVFSAGFVGRFDEHIEAGNCSELAKCIQVGMEAVLPGLMGRSGGG